LTFSAARSVIMIMLSRCLLESRQFTAILHIS
jgi:hypothetical protein